MLTLSVKYEEKVIFRFSLFNEGHTIIPFTIAFKDSSMKRLGNNNKTV